MKKFVLKWIVALCLVAFVSVSAFSFEEKRVNLGRFYGDDHEMIYYVISSPDDLLDWLQDEYGDEDTKNFTLSDFFPGMKAEDLPKGKFCILNCYEKGIDHVPENIKQLIPDWSDEKDNLPIVGLDYFEDPHFMEKTAKHFSLNSKNLLFITNLVLPDAEYVTFPNKKLFFLNKKLDEDLFLESIGDVTKKRFRDAGYKGDFDF